MSAGVKFYSFVGKLGIGAINLDADNISIYLTNTAPNIATMSNKADLAEIATGHGYTGPIPLDCAYSQSGGIGTLTGNSTTTITASGGSIGPFRYVVAFDDTAAGDPLICYWDYGANYTINDGSSFRFNLDDPATVMATIQ